ncbi:MAG: hypothetical protein HZB55_16395 [Deltaproteobacteria bacterium]|nr:hypothetical protein [Deltaproteobacteria bacterium]
MLAGSLRAAGARVSVFDANLEVQEALFAPGRLGHEAAVLAQSGAPAARVTSARRAALGTTRAVECLRDVRTYRDLGAYRAAVNRLEEACRVLSRAGSSRLSLSDLTVEGLSPLSSSDLGAVARDPSALPFADELAALVPRILEGAPRLIGVSAVYLSQALPAFALAGLLRRAGYGGRLVLGGGVVSSWAPRLGPQSVLFEAWDALVAGPGEEALGALLGHGDPRDASGVLAPALGVWNAPATGGRAPVWFEPDPKGLPWDRYLSPGPVLPLATSRGCYWGRCAFCPEATEGRQGFQTMRAGALRDAVLRARDTHGFRWVHLTDDAVPPGTLRTLARGLQGEGVRWYGFARLEAALLDPAFSEELAAGGCAMLQLGVETASQRLLDGLGKGTRIADVGAMLRNVARAGIRTYVYLLFGIPTETAEEARTTGDWAVRHADAVTFLNLALLNLPRGSELERDPARYGLTELHASSGSRDLSLYRSYASEGGGSRRDLRRVLAAVRARPEIRRILARTPPGFTSNHAAFAPLDG